MRYYEGSDGRQYAETDICEKLECGEWNVFCWNVETQLQVVETEEREFLFLRPAATEPATAGDAREEHI